ncbi:hypothetical protein VitviT2T_005364 [Vitis vinifera]|uniref:Integrase catalytic domain-containing protein n=1 Tax=Vitis vinifera TaxID=29760 RepID=A0ABY9BTC9_VITVI|nr:hypothetical protein VitviT2T_005364 [Vitis vinifera]
MSGHCLAAIKEIENVKVLCSTLEALNSKFKERKQQEMSHRRGRVQIVSPEDELDNLQLLDIQPAATTTPSSSDPSDSSDPSVVGVDYVSKWVEAIACNHNDHKVVVKFLKENIFTRFGVPKAIISDEGTHFCNKIFNNLLTKYGVKHKVATPYHPQTSGQVELANCEIKNILMKVVNANHKDWALRLHDAL